jgi:DNA-binding beta-propeller fold protein YncE
VAVDASGNLYIAGVLSDRIRKVSAAGIITTVAGNGSAGYSGDGGLATSAQLWGPGGVVVDASGNLYIADAGNNRVRMVTASGHALRRSPRP